MNPSELDVVILCGGLGTRFRQVDPQTPKVMASVEGRPFLDWIIELFYTQGCRRFIFCTGYKSDVIEAYLRTSKYGIETEVVISKETEPLGTAGAVKHAEKSIHSEPFLLVNGDSYCKIDLAAFIQFHIRNNACVSMALVSADTRKDTGSVALDTRTLEVAAFQEKGTTEGTYSNAGIYIFSKKIISRWNPAQPLSLEYDIFPKLVGQGLYGFVVDGPVIDIGTPERYYGAAAYFKNQNT